MQINIVTTYLECADFLNNFKLIDNHTFQLEIDNDDYPDSIAYKFGWNTWIKISKIPFYKGLNSYSNLNREILKINILPLKDFLGNNKTLTFDKLQSLFLYRTHENYQTYTVYDRIVQTEALKINNDCFGLSLGFIYHEIEGKLVIEDEDVMNAYNQLKIFYSSFTKTHNSSLLFMLPYLDQDAIDQTEILLGHVYDNNSPFDHFSDSDGWTELGKEEEKRMEADSDGFWTWNIE